MTRRDVATFSHDDAKKEKAKTTFGKLDTPGQGSTWITPTLPRLIQSCQGPKQTLAHAFSFLDREFDPSYSG